MLTDLSLLDFIPSLSPEHTSPHHLTEWCSLIEQSLSAKVRALCDVPIRHFKTETTCHGVAWLLTRDPSLRIIYLTYSDTTAQKRGKRIRDLCTAADVGPKRGYDTIVDWQNEHGGGVVVMSAKQSRLGLDCHILIFDDPLDEHDADDADVRDAVDATIAHYTARCIRRGKEGSVLGLMSRWHPDDPIGRRLKRKAVDWKYVHQPAIIDEGTDQERAFAPDVMSLETLKSMRAELKEQDPTERLWWSQLMGEPTPLGGDLFGPVTRYQELPNYAYRAGIGIDMAFSVGSGSDWFARVVGRAYGHKLYITDVARHKLDTHQIESTLSADLNKHGRCMIFSYMSGPEIGTAKLLVQRGIPILRMHARYNKLVRAQKTIRRWNDGDVLVPEDSAAMWVPGFLHRMSLFRGHEKDRDDDEVDALVSLADGLMGSVVAGAPKNGGVKAYGGF